MKVFNFRNKRNDWIELFSVLKDPTLQGIGWRKRVKAKEKIKHGKLLKAYLHNTIFTYTIVIVTYDNEC